MLPSHSRTLPKQSVCMKKNYVRLNSQGWLLPHKFFASEMFITVNLLLWTDVSLSNVLGCFPSFDNSSKKLCIVLWPSGWENFNPFCYFWFGPIMTLSLIIKLSPIVWQGNLYIIFIPLYFLMYTRVCPIMSLECYIKARTFCIPLSWSSTVSHLNLASTWTYDKIESNCHLCISF